MIVPSAPRRPAASATRTPASTAKPSTPTPIPTRCHVGRAGVAGRGVAGASTLDHVQPPLVVGPQPGVVVVAEVARAVLLLEVGERPLEEARRSPLHEGHPQRLQRRKAKARPTPPTTRTTTGMIQTSADAAARRREQDLLALRRGEVGPISSSDWPASTRSAISTRIAWARAPDPAADWPRTLGTGSSTGRRVPAPRPCASLPVDDPDDQGDGDHHRHGGVGQRPPHANRARSSSRPSAVTPPMILATIAPSGTTR